MWKSAEHSFWQIAPFLCYSATLAAVRFHCSTLDSATELQKYVKYIERTN